jgi:hypothetical protein
MGWWRHSLQGFAPFLSVLLACSIACGSTSTYATQSPTADAATRYVALVHDYWIQYKKAEGDIPSLIRVCGYYSSLRDVQPSVCRTRIALILPSHENFVSALDATPAPPQFAVDDEAFRTQLPIAIAHLKATMAAADAGKAQQVSDEVEAYVEAMIPLFPHLDHVDPSIAHN